MIRLEASPGVHNIFKFFFRTHKGKTKGKYKEEKCQTCKPSPWRCSAKLLLQKVFPWKAPSVVDSTNCSDILFPPTHRPTYEFSTYVKTKWRELHQRIFRLRERGWLNGMHTKIAFFPFFFREHTHGEFLSFSLRTFFLLFFIPLPMSKWKCSPLSLCRRGWY